MLDTPAAGSGSTREYTHITIGSWQAICSTPTSRARAPRGSPPPVPRRRPRHVRTACHPALAAADRRRGAAPTARRQQPGPGQPDHPAARRDLRPERARSSPRTRRSSSSPSCRPISSRAGSRHLRPAERHGRRAGTRDPRGRREAQDRRPHLRPGPDQVERAARDGLLVEQDLANLPGVKVTVESARKYTDGPLLAHILGYLGPISPAVLSPAEYKQKIEKDGYTINDKIGAAGLEDTYESVLRGRPGRQMYEVEASGREVGTLRVERPEPGKNLVMTIDLDLQRTVTQYLSEGLYHGSVGVAVVSDAEDRRDPGAGQPAELRRQRLRRRQPRGRARGAAERSRAAVLPPRHRRQLPARLDVQAGDRPGRPPGGRRQPQHDHREQGHPLGAARLLPGLSAAVPGLVGAGEAELPPGDRQLVQHLLLLPRRRLRARGVRGARQRAAGPLRAHVRLRRADRHRPARRDGRARSPTRPGRSRRSARSGSRATPTTCRSARATSRRARCRSRT